MLLAVRLQHQKERLWRSLADSYRDDLVTCRSDGLFRREYFAVLVDFDLPRHGMLSIVGHQQHLDTAVLQKRAGRELRHRFQWNMPCLPGALDSDHRPREFRAAFCRHSCGEHYRM